MRAYAYDGDALLVGVTDGTRTWVIDRNDPATPGVSNSTGRVESISDGELTVTPSYTPFGEIDTYTYEIDSTEYVWDLSVDIGGRIEGKAETLGVTASDYGYEYDAIGQLEQVVDHLDSDAVVESYDYDPNGNRTASTVDYGTSVSRTYAYNADDQLTAINGDEVEYSYDLDGFLTERRRDTGSGAEVTGYVFNTRGELLSVDLPTGGTVERVEYTYDPLGRRVARRAYDDEHTLLSTEKYLWNGMTELLAVYDGSNQLKLRFDYLGGGLPVCVNVWDGSEFDYYYLAYDQVGSLRYVFDEAGSLAKAVTYDAFGNVLSDSNPSLKLPLGFAGGHLDRDTGLVRFVARDYDPEIGRWTAGDPLGVQGGLNAYLYVGNNPVNITDPYGLAPGLLDRIHDGLGLLGMVPVIGIVGDIGAFGVSVIQLDVTGALIDAGSMLPLAGGAVRGGQLAYKAGKAVLKNADEVVKHGDELVDLFRAVGPDELSNIAETGKFINKGSAEGKYFSLCESGASDYAKQAVKAFKDPPYTNVRTQIPRSQLPAVTPVDGGIPAVVIPDAQLPYLSPTILDSMKLP